MVIEFDGVNDYLDCGNKNYLWSQPLTKFSFSCWIYPTSGWDGFNREIVEKSGSSAHGFRLEIDDSTVGQIKAHVKDSLNVTKQSLNNNLILNQWNFLVFVYDNSLVSANVKVYVNTIPPSVTGDLTETINQSANLTLGQSGNALKGFMKDFRFWKKRALSQSEVIQLYEGRDEHELTPDYWLPMDETTGEPKSYGLHGELKNGCQWDHNSVYFNGMGAYIDCGNEPTLWGASQTKFSYSFWTKFKETTITQPYRTLVSIWDEANGWGTTCYQDQTNPKDLWFDVQLTAGWGGAQSEDTIKVVDKWYFVTCVYDDTLGSNDIKIYVDGVQGADTSTGKGTFNVANAVLHIGDGTFGNIKQFKFWNGIALTPTEIALLYRGDSEMVIAPHYELDLDEDKGYMVYDDITNGFAAIRTNGARWAYPYSDLPTTDPSYNNFLNFKIVIKSNDEMKTYYRYDSYGSKPFKVHGLRVSLADAETDLAMLLIEDNDGLIDDNKLSGGVKYFISLAAGATVPYEDIFVGYGETMDTLVEARNKIFKSISIFGSKVVATYRYLNYNKAAKLNDLQDPASINSSGFTSRDHVDRAINNDDELLYNPILISDRAGWDQIDLSKDVKTIIGGIAIGIVNLWDFMEFNKSITGAVWGVEWRKKKERYYYQFPELDQTSVILKSGYEIVKDVDLANKTSWVYPPFAYTKDTSIDINHSTILHGITDTDDTFIAGNSETGGNNSLTFKALGQSLPLPADARRIKRINLMLSMKGEVSSPENKVNGKICLSDSAGKPLGTTLDHFSIPLSEIEEDPKVVSVNVDIDPNKIAKDTEVWIVLYQRSGTDETDKGEPNHDESRTILWHHNNKVNVTGQRKSAKVSEGDRHKEPLAWQTTTSGPVYACSIHSDIQRIQTVMTPQHFGTFGIKERVINVSDLTDRKTVNAYLAFKAFITALPKTYIATIKAKLPNNFFFRPNQMVFMGLVKPRINQMQRVKRITYDIIPIRDQVGENVSSRIVTLSLEGSYNPADYVKFPCEY